LITSSKDCQAAEWDNYTHDEQRALKARGLEFMVYDEAYMEDEDGVCRQEMKWLAPTGLKMLPIEEIFGPKGVKFPADATAALAQAGYKFPLGRDDFVFVCCEPVWVCPGDVAVEEMFCCDKQDTSIYSLVANPRAIMSEGVAP
jgi:hypothetical protein